MQGQQASLSAVTFTDSACPVPPPSWLLVLRSCGLLGNWSSEAVVSSASLLGKEQSELASGRMPCGLRLAAGAWGGLGASDLALGTALGKQPSGPGSAYPLLF